MSDAIVRLRVQSDEYNNKIKQATQELLRMEQEFRKVGGTLTSLDKEQIAFVRGLGSMETKSRTARGKIRELTQSFTELSLMFKRMTDEEKNGSVGKALSASLDQLKGRISEAKGDLASVEAEMKNASADSGNLSNALSTLASKFGLSAGMVKNFAGALAPTVVAVKVAKDAFFNSEMGIDDWGRTVEASQTIYEAFLTSLNTGDFSGFLTNIGQVQKAAIDAYNALDLLGTQKSIQGPQMSGKQAEIGRMEMMLRTGRFIESADGRVSPSGLKTGDLLSEAQKATIAKNLESAMKEVATITTSQVETATNAIDKLYAEQAATLGISKKEFMEATKNWENFTDALDKSNKYWKWRTANTTYTSLADNLYNPLPSPTSIATWMTPRENYDDSKNPYRGYGWVKTFKDDGEMWKRLTEEITKRDAAQSQLYSQYGRMYRQLNRVEGINPYGGGSGSKGASWAPIAMGEVGGLDFATGVAGVDWGDAYTRDFRKDIKNLKLPEEEKNEKTMVGELQKITGGVQGMLSGLNQLGVEIPEGLGNVISGISGVLSVLQSINMIVGTIQTIETVGTFLGIFGNGGIVPHAAAGFTVPGHDFADRTPIMAQSGELILNRVQQGNLVSQMNGVSGGSIDVQPWVDGEKIFLGMNNTSRRMGKGEIVTTSMLRSRGLW